MRPNDRIFFHGNELHCAAPFAQGLVLPSQSEEALGDLLGDVAVDLAGGLELRSQRALLRECRVGTAERAQAPRDAPAGDPRPDRVVPALSFREGDPEQLERLRRLGEP